MTPEAQRIAIAEACGLTNIGLRLIAADSGMDQYVWCSGVIGSGGIELPNYLNDLNAMHDAEEVLQGMDRAQYAVILNMVAGRDWPHGVGSGCFVHVRATAAQRAESFLRTIGKWEDGK